VRFLVDNALSPAVAEELRRGGHDATHVRDYGLQSADDEAICSRGADEDRIIVSADTDFGGILALAGRRKPSIILVRRASGRRPSQQATVLLSNLPDLADALLHGCTVVLEDARVRVRLLPIGGEADA
jgi:predicted nuclease of predicted toxin-antitoxin system